MRRCRITTVFLPVALLFASVLPAASFGWCYKEHIQFTRIAAQRLIDDPTTPRAMKAWLEQAIPQRLDMAGEREYFLNTRIGLEPKGYENGLLHWTYMPDVRAFDKSLPNVQPFDASERVMHFIDLELFLAGETPRVYKPDLKSKPQIENVPNDPKDKRYVQAGYLPLRTAQVYAELVKAIRENRLQPATPDDENNAVVLAGYLAHYVADNTQPQHATIDYKSASYFKVKGKAPNVHAAVEYMMCDDEKDYPELRKEFWLLFEQQLDLMQDPIATDDLFKATLQVAMLSYDALPLIGEAAAKSSRLAAPKDRIQTIDVELFFRYRGTVAGRGMSVMEMKARQTALAVKRIERVWKQAWIEAERG